MTLGQRHVIGIVLRVMGLALLAAALLALEWAWRSHAWSNLKSVDGQCVMVGAQVDNGRVPRVACEEDGARYVNDVVKPGTNCPHGLTRVSVRHELSHDTGYVGALCVRNP
ncbi:hypothetical protein [Cutibacterium sp.]|uniref:hypothetical protein n=1 Tax=Cutibacterium sp. TaxID=1912221 RepID=UPI0026DAE123|nr:hypothetical protein [Cutibacterium sp.]MDO4412739.1 hypothetical protein [Cutibacterium sp.]